MTGIDACHKLDPSTLFLCECQYGEDFDNGSLTIEKLLKRLLPAHKERGYTEIGGSVP